jgi:hypothetical protein
MRALAIQVLPKHLLIRIVAVFMLRANYRHNLVMLSFVLLLLLHVEEQMKRCFYGLF